MTPPIPAARRGGTRTAPRLRPTTGPDRAERRDGADSAPATGGPATGAVWPGGRDLATHRGLDPELRARARQGREDAAHARMAGNLTESVILNALAELDVTPPDAIGAQLAINATIARALGHPGSDPLANLLIVRNLLLDRLADQLEMRRHTGGYL